MGSVPIKKIQRFTSEFSRLSLQLCVRKLFSSLIKTDRADAAFSRYDQLFFQSNQIIMKITHNIHPSKIGTHTKS